MGFFMPMSVHLRNKNLKFNSINFFSNGLKDGIIVLWIGADIRVWSWRAKFYSVFGDKARGFELVLSAHI